MYSVREWMLYFIIYCFLGWLIESTIVSISTRKITNRGMLRGPVLPIYGFGALTMLISTYSIVKWPIAVYIVGLIAATVLEYIVGTVIESVFKMKYWDYSKDKFNFQGKICLESSLFWGLLTLVLTYGIHRPIAKLIENIPVKTQTIIIVVIGLLMMTDAVVAVKEAFNLKKVLRTMSHLLEQLESHTVKVKDELEDIKKSLEATQNKLFNRITKSFPTATISKSNLSFSNVKKVILAKLEAAKQSIEKNK